MPLSTTIIVLLGVLLLGGFVGLLLGLVVQLPHHISMKLASAVIAAALGGAPVLFMSDLSGDERWMYPIGIVLGFLAARFIGARKPPKDSARTVLLTCEKLEGRDALYLKAAALLESATYVVDTTWGLDPKAPSKQETKARKEYLAAQEAAIRRGATYLELFTTTETQLNEMNALFHRFHRLANYEVKVLRNVKYDIPLMDFMVTNREYVLLSHVSSSPGLTCCYLYLRSSEVANLFLGLFDECWNRSETPEGAANPAPTADG